MGEEGKEAGEWEGGRGRKGEERDRGREGKEGGDKRRGGGGSPHAFCFGNLGSPVYILQLCYYKWHHLMITLHIKNYHVFAVDVLFRNAKQV